MASWDRLEIRERLRDSAREAMMGAFRSSVTPTDAHSAGGRRAL
jgi:hypothetical protein